jgi:MFS transporter, DHA2 family, multidrug resistance protein
VTTDPQAVPVRAGRREWIGLAVIALPCVLYSMDLTVLYLAVPSLTADLAPTSSELLWITDIYGFLLAGCLITMGTLGDRIGRRKLLLIGAAAFGVVSVLAAFSTSVEMLIASRALLGITAATLAPSTLSLIRNMFLDPQQRTVAIGVWATSFSVGAAIGPLLGGLMLEFFWWGSVFLLAVPVMAALLVVGPKLLPEFRDPDAGRLDIVSAALSLVAVLAAIYGVKQLAENGWSAVAVASIAIGVIGGVAFVLRQRHLTDPLIDLSLFRIPAFAASLAANTVVIGVAFGTFLFTAQYLQLVLGLSPLEAGAWTLPSTAGFIVGAMAAPFAVRRLPTGVVIAVGLVVAALGLAILAMVDSGSGLAHVVFASFVIGLGMAPVVTLATDVIIGCVPPERAGVASGISETGAELGGALGIAILGSIGVALYRDRMVDAIPAGVSADQAALARDTLGGAAAAAESVSGASGTALLEAARDAFADGMRVAALAGLAITLAAAFATTIALRRFGGNPEPS